MENVPSKVPTQWATTQAVPVGWMKQFRYLARLYELIRDIPGDIVECGLGEGNTFSMLAYLAGSDRNHKRRLWGFDSFEGWPEPTKWDVSPRNPKKGEWAVTEEMVRTRIEESGISKKFPNLDLRIVKGFFDRTLPDFPNRPIAFLHIDADLYPGYRDVLNFLFPKVVLGGVVAFDEYREFPNGPEYGEGTIEKWPGASKAIDDYFTNRSEVIQFHPETGKYYLMKKRK